MQILHDLEQVRLHQPTALSIGNFDGVHRGHQALLTEVRNAALANGRLAGIVTFDPHPVTVLRPATVIAELTTLAERLQLLEREGLDFVIIHPFTAATAQTPARAFAELLVWHARMASLHVGPDFAFGRGREGTVERLHGWGRELGFAVQTVEPHTVDGTEVHSGVVRRQVLEGDVAAAARGLGRLYALPGVVVAGERRGRQLGFATANLDVAAQRVVPANGVYAAWAEVAGERWPAAVNIGVRPSFGAAARTVEAHLLDFAGDLYGQTVTLHFLRRLRDEMRFPGLDALKAQIQADVQRTRHLLAADAVYYEELEHTADWAIRVWGRNLAELYANAARAMFDLMGEPEPAAPLAVRRDVVAEAVDTEATLVEWLNRLLLHQELHHELYRRFDVRVATPTRLVATAHGLPGKPARAKIKAATYHELEVVETDDGASATLVFDV